MRKDNYENDAGRITPVILSGGSGTRLWPLSRKARPKQFLRLAGSSSPFQEACARVNDSLFRAPIVLSNAVHRFLVAEQIREMGERAAAIVLEPVARNTAPAALVAALIAAREVEDALVLLLPSDQEIGDKEGFTSSIRNGVAAAEAGQIVTFGVQPDHPHTGYGYIEVAEKKRDGALPVRRFVEKPSRQKAEEYLRAGNYYWNAGIFMFRADIMIESFQHFHPDMIDFCRESLKKAREDLDFLRLDEVAYARCPDISLDYAIMEKAKNIACVPLKCGWNDLGSWNAVAECLEKDEHNNAGHGDPLFVDSRNCLGYSADDVHVALLGLENVVVVATRDAVLVASREAVQDVKKVVAKLREKNSSLVTAHTRVYRPWGWYEGLAREDRFQVKRIMVKPGEQLSLQSHFHRAEHWVVVSGTAKVTVGDRTALLTEGQSVYVPLGEKHRLENPGRIPLRLIEVQVGAYLEEDDIVRYEDIYSRTD